MTEPEHTCGECEAVKALWYIKTLLGYGIYGSPTDGEYHRTSYSEAYEIAKKACEAFKPREKGDGDAEDKG